MRIDHVILGILLLTAATPGTMLASVRESALPSDDRGGSIDVPASDDFASVGDWSKADGFVCCSPCPCIYGFAELLFLERTNCASNQPLIVDLAGDGEIVAATSDLDFDYEPAVRVGAGRRLHNGWALEASYLGLCDADGSWSSAAAGESEIWTLPGDLPLGTNVFPDIDRVRIDYSSALHAADINLVCCCGCCCSGGKGKQEQKGACAMGCRTWEWFVGFRYFNLNEELSIYAERDQLTGGGTTAAESGVYNVRTSNNLFGPQLGGRLRRWGTRFGWEAVGRVGIFGNDAHQEQYVIDYDQFPLRPTTSAAQGQVAFAGDLGVSGLCRMNDVWNLRAGYNVIILSGVALAPDQLDFGGAMGAGNQLSSNGSVLLHGVSFGLEARW